MAAGSYREVCTLSNADIASVMEKLERWLGQQKVEKQNLLQLSLSLEEILLRWQDRFGPDQAVTVVLGRRLGQALISMSVRGDACDPLQWDEGELDWSKRLLADLGLAPTYSYHRGVNQVWLKLKRKKISPLVQILCAAALAAVVGLAGLALLPQQVAAISQLLLQPVRSTLLGLLSAVAVPMIFLSVLLGVCGSGDAATFGKIGNRMLLRFVGKTVLFTAIAELLVLPLFSLQLRGGSMDAEQFSGALEMVLAMLPSNLFEPFLTGNTLQIIVIAVAAGLALLLLGSRGDTVKRFAEEVNSVIYLLLDWVSTLLPLIVFLLLLETFWAGNAAVLTCIWKPLVLSLAACLLLPAANLLALSRRLRISPLKLLRKMLPALTVALGTSSSAAAYSTHVKCCEKDLGISPKITGFGIPLGTVAYIPLVSIYFLLCVFCGAEQYGTACSAVWLVVACLSASLLAFATPPVPGGAIACYAVLFAQMGIPAEALALALAMDAVIDRFNTTANLAMQQLELLSQAHRQKLLDHDRLHADL